jgi:uncharacterized protein
MNELRIDVADLLAHPAARRALRTDAAVEDLGTPVAVIREPVALDLALERVPEGIVVRGAVAASYEAQCSNCLRPVRGRVAVEVSELFEDHPVDGDTYPIEGHVIALEQLLRDSLLLELPLAPACPESDADCVADPDARFTGASADETGEMPADPRWAALSELEL